MQCLLKLALSLTLFYVGTASARLSDPSLPFNNPVSVVKDIRFEDREAYIYAEAIRSEANWAYIGYAPRMEDPGRVRVLISKTGLTMRVTMKMNPYEVGDFPHYLVSRLT